MASINVPINVIPTILSEEEAREQLYLRFHGARCITHGQEREAADLVLRILKVAKVDPTDNRDQLIRFLNWYHKPDDKAAEYVDTFLEGDCW